MLLSFLDFNYLILDDLVLFYLHPLFIEKMKFFINFHHIIFIFSKRIIINFIIIILINPLIIWIHYLLKYTSINLIQYLIFNFFFLQNIINFLKYFVHFYGSIFFGFRFVYLGILIILIILHINN